MKSLFLLGGVVLLHTLCGPMLLNDPDTRPVVAHQPDAAGLLKPSDSFFVGVFPKTQPLSDTTITWSGTRWGELLWHWPMREDPDMRHVTFAHELFHRIQRDVLRIEKAGRETRILTLSRAVTSSSWSGVLLLKLLKQRRPNSERLRSRMPFCSVGSDTGSSRPLQEPNFSGVVRGRNLYGSFSFHVITLPR